MTPRFQKHSFHPSFKQRQVGAVLYIALIMLVLLALIGVVGMQVATLQERMASNFLASNMAFQNAEDGVRSREAEIVGGTGAYSYEDCTAKFDPTAWANGLATSVISQTRTMNISICTGQCSAKIGAEKELCNVYRTTTFSRDRGSVAESTSAAAVDTIFIKP
jgi:type IV pilus assembly protein PilX